MKSVFDVRPDAIMPLGNGSFYYNYNIVEKEVETEEGEKKTVYECDTVQVWNEPTYAKLVKAVIREAIDETEEFNKVNSFNAAQLGMLEEEEAAKAVAEYKDYLNFVAEVKTQVKADLQPKA